MAKSSVRERPARQSKFVNESLPPDLRCDYAAKPFDEAMRAAERKWGIGRLPALVSTETAAKWGSAMGKLNAAIEAKDPDEVAARAAVCVRGLASLDAEATSAGKQTLPSGALAGEVEGLRFVILPDHRCWPQYQDEFPDHVMLTLQQVGIAVKDQLENNPVLKEAKKHFPNAEIKQIRPQTETERFLDDEIPF